MEHVLEKDKYYTRLQTNSAAKKFLSERVKEVKKILNKNSKKHSTKIFSYPANSYNLSKNDNGFKCGIERYGLNYYEMHSIKTFDTHFDTNKIHNTDLKLSEILLPDLDLSFNNEDYINILSHEGYQLK